MSDAMVRITKTNATEFKKMTKYLRDKYNDISSDGNIIVHREFNPFKDDWIYFSLIRSYDGWLSVSLEDGLGGEILKSFKQEAKYVSSNKLTSEEIAECLFSSYIDYCALVEGRYTRALQKQPGHFEFKIRLKMQKNIMD